MNINITASKTIYLMHKNHPVAVFNADSYGHIKSLKEIINKVRFPVHAMVRTPEQGMLVIQMWEKGRMIPDVRQNLLRIQSCVGMSPEEAYVRSLKVSLNDCYWYKEKGSPLTWEDVNFYDNGFKQDFFLNIICNTGLAPKTTNFPDITTNGVLEKAWVWHDRLPFLVKRGDFGELSKMCPGKNLLSANEIVAFEVGKMLKINVVDYYPIRIGNELLCICPSFIKDSNTEFVTAEQLQRHYRLGSTELYRAICDNGMKKDVDNMIYFDHMIHNPDRHLLNFGIIRNAETLKIKGFCPLFDNGSSFGFRKEKDFTRPFAETRVEQLLLLDEPPIPPDIKYIAKNLKDVYKEFEIPEEVLGMALSDLDHSYKIYDDFLNNKDREEVKDDWND